MNTQSKINGYSFIGLALMIIGFVLIALGFFNYDDKTAFSGSGDTSCTVSTTTAVGIGAQTSTTIVPAGANIAYVRIQQPVFATNTVALGLGATANITTSGIKLAPGTASSTPDVVTFGLNAPFPYTGSVQAITNVGSTTVNVVICKY